MNDVVKETPQPGALDQPPRNPRKRALWTWAIGISGLIYLAMVLFLDLYSPVFGAVLIVLAGYEVIEARFRRRNPTAPSEVRSSGSGVRHTALNLREY